MALQHLGLAIGTMRLLSVPGRKSGKLRTTPVSPLVVNGQRYIVAGLEGADWVKNARAAGWGILACGRKEERVRLVELPVEEREPILRASRARCRTGFSFSSGCMACRANRRILRRSRPDAPYSGWRRGADDLEPKTPGAGCGNTRRGSESPSSRLRGAKPAIRGVHLKDSRSGSAG